MTFYVNMVDYSNLSDSLMYDDFTPALAAAYHGLILAMMAKVADCGFKDMTPAFANLIPLLDPAGKGSRARELAQRSGVTKQAMSQLVRELERRGYVEQVLDPTDTRAKLVRLTGRGMALRAACTRVRKELNQAAGRSFGPVRLKRLQRDLEALSAAVGSVPKRAV